MSIRYFSRFAAALLIASTIFLLAGKAAAGPPLSPFSYQGGPNPGQSTVDLHPLTGLTANGVDEVTITVTVLNAQGQPLPDHIVHIASSHPLDMIAQPVAPTDANGVAIATMATEVPGTKVIVATVDPDGASIQISQQPTFVFSEPVVQPNVIIIFIDDVGTDALSLWDEINPYQADLPYVHGVVGAGDVPANGPGASNLYIHAPALQQLADEGVTFLNAYAQPLCSPSRATLLTGNYPVRTGVGFIMFAQYLGGTLNEFGDPGFEFLTLANVITSAGYDDKIIGKWHLGMPSPQMDPSVTADIFLNWATIPYRGGFTEWMCTLRGLNSAPQPPGGGTYYNFYQSHNQLNHAQIVAEGPTTEFCTTVQFDEALAWCNSRTKPFVCVVQPISAHSPWNLLPPQNLLWTEEYAEPPLNAWSGHLAQMESLDAKLGDLINGLDPAIRAVTTFIFIGDNGTPQTVLAQARQTGAAGGVTGSDKNLGATYDFLLDQQGKRFKSTVYEKGCRVPMIVAGYGVTNPGRVSMALTDVSDILPTVADMLGVQIESDLHGISIVPILEDTVDYLTHERDFIYMETFTPLGSTGPDVTFDSRAVALSLRIPGQGRYKLVTDQNDVNNYFYKLQDADGAFVDPFETVSLPHGPSDPEHANYLLVLERLQAVVASGDDTGPLACQDLSNFCSSTPNSTGLPALMSQTGSCSISAKSFTLVGQPVPNQYGIFFYSVNQVNGGNGVPYGHGLRCVGGNGSQVNRLPITLAEHNVLSYHINFNELPSGGEILPGSTWHFQGWYRDPAAGGDGFNLTDGLTANFTP